MLCIVKVDWYIAFLSAFFPWLAKCENIYLRPCSSYFRNKVIEKITQCRISKSYSLFTIKLLSLKIILEIWWNWHLRVRVSALILFAENLLVVTTSTSSFKSIFVIICHACCNAYMPIQAYEYQSLRMTQSAQVCMHGTSGIIAVVTSFDNQRLQCAQKMSAAEVYLVLQMFTFLRPKWLGGEDLNGESCSCNAVSGRTKYKKKRWMCGSLGMKVDVWGEGVKWWHTGMARSKTGHVSHSRVGEKGLKHRSPKHRTEVKTLHLRQSSASI